MSAEEIQAFITYLAIQRQLSASTQNQALSAIIFLYRHVLQMDIALPSDIFRAEKSETLSVVLTHQEAMSVINKMTGVPQLTPALAAQVQVWQRSSTAPACT
jgi:hypothetical protein